MPCSCRLTAVPWQPCSIPSPAIIPFFIKMKLASQTGENLVAHLLRRNLSHTESIGKRDL
jgi:hypothetical protein